jgi:hypothetical protein
MADGLLAQEEADELIAMEKHRADEDVYDFPSPGRGISIPLLAADERETFVLDLYRGRIDLHKATYQTRGRSVIVLVRLDLSGPPHRNPDGAEMPAPHLHLYREGYADKWAFPLPVGVFSDPSDLWKTFQEFMSYCNVTRPPNMQPGLFSS